MLSASDLEKLQSAQQAVDLAQKTIADLYRSDNPLLAEHALELLESLTKMNKKLQRLLSVTKRS